MFDDIMHTTEDGTVEFWYARELMGCLGYTTWRRFKDAINRAMESCKSAEIEVSDHFANAVKMVEIGSNAVRDVGDIRFTDMEKKTFMKSFLEEVNIYEAEQEDGRILRSLKFRFPVFFNNQELYELDWDNESTVKVVICLQRVNS